MSDGAAFLAALGVSDPHPIIMLAIEASAKQATNARNINNFMTESTPSLGKNQKTHSTPNQLNEPRPCQGDRQAGPVVGPPHLTTRIKALEDRGWVAATLAGKTQFRGRLVGILAIYMPKLTKQELNSQVIDWKQVPMFVCNECGIFSS